MDPSVGPTKTYRPRRAEMPLRTLDIPQAGSHRLRQRQSRGWLTTWHPDNILPVAMLAVELNTTVDALVRKIGDDQIVLDDIGLRCITRQAAHAVIAEQAVRQARQRELDAANAVLSAKVA